MDGAAVTEFFSLDESPTKPSSAHADDTVRDHYGFMVPSDYHELYRVYSPVWEQEETEREALWCHFLGELAHLNADDGKFANLEDLCADYLQDAVTIARHEHGPPSPHRQKLDALVRGGIPFTIRGSVWTVFLDTSVRKQRNYYNDLVKRCLGDLQYRGTLELDEIRQQAALAAQSLQDAAALHGLSGYAAVTEKALATWRANSKVWLTQIEKDLPRTFPGLALMEISGRPALRRVLAAYSLHNSRVGYCQGLNFVTGTLLLFLDEEDAFWCLCALLEDILKGYYDVDMMAMQVDQRVFKRLVAEHFPELAAHLEGLGADVSCVFVQWFLCVFVNFLPIEACLRVWDALFYYRSPTVLFKTALALLAVFSPALSRCGDVLDALDLMQSLAPLTYDSNRLIARAFGPAFEGVTDVRLATLRREYREEVEAEAAAMAEEMAWEASSLASGATAAGGGAGSGAAAPHTAASSQVPQYQPPQPSNSKISVLKMIARGMKEKFTGVGGGGNIGTGSGATAGGSGAGGTALHGSSGTNSVERASSPAPDGGGSLTASVALGAGSAAAAGGGRGTDELLLVRSPQPLDGGGGVDADSEDYHRLNGDDGFQYEQVGYVAPPEPSGTAGAMGVECLDLLMPTVAAALPPQHPKPQQSHEQDRPQAVVTPALTEAAERCSDGSAAAIVPKGGGAVTNGHTTALAPASKDPLEQLLEVAAAFDSAPVGRAEGNAGGSGDGPVRSSSFFMWHETPKWASVRLFSATGAPVAAPGSAAASPGPAAAATTTGLFVQPPTSPTASGEAVPAGSLSPHVLMLTAGRSQSLSAGLAMAAADDDGDDNGAVQAATAAAAADLLPNRPEIGSESSAAPPPPSMAEISAAAAASAAPPNGAATPGVGVGGGGSDFSQVQAVDQARRAQGGKRRVSKAASLAWDIALAPLKLRQQQQQQRRGDAMQQLPAATAGPADACCEADLGHPPGLHALHGLAATEVAAVAAPGAHSAGSRSCRRSGSVPSGPAAAVGPLAQLGEGHPGRPAQLSAVGTVAATATMHGHGGAQPLAAAPSAALPLPIATPSAAIPLAALPGAGGPHAAHGKPHLHHGGAGGAYAVHFPAFSGGATATAMHPPAGSSFASTTCSVLLLDEHKEASPAEARDEWVIMSAPSETLPPPSPSQRPQPHPLSSHLRSHSHAHGFHSVGHPAAAALAAGPRGSGPGLHSQLRGGLGGREHSGRSTAAAAIMHAAASGAGGDDPTLGPCCGSAGGGRGSMGKPDAHRTAAATSAPPAGAGEGAAGGFGGGGSHGAGGVGPPDGPGGLTAGGGSGGGPTEGGQLADDLGGPAVQEMREALGVEDLLRHHNALAVRLRRLQQAAEAAAEPAAVAASVRPAAATERALAAVIARGPRLGRPSSCGGGSSEAAAPEAAAAVDAQGTTAPGRTAEAAGFVPASAAVPALGDGGLASTCLERLTELQCLLESLAAAAAAAAADADTGPPEPGDGAAVAAVAPPPTSIAATAGGSGSFVAAAAAAGSLLQEGLQPLPLPYAAVAAPPAVSPFDQLVVGPGGQVRLQAVAATTPPLPALAAVAGLLAADSPAAGVAQQQQQQQQQQQERLLREAVGLCSSLRYHLDSSRRREAAMAELLAQYGVLSEVLGARLEEVVRQLAEQQYTIDKLSTKLDQTMQKYAAQDTALADKDYAIRSLQFQLRSGGHPVISAAAGGLGGGGGSRSPISGLSSGLSSALGFGGGGGGGGAALPAHQSESGGAPGGHYRGGAAAAAVTGGTVGHGQGPAGATSGLAGPPAHGGGCSGSMQGFLLGGGAGGGGGAAAAAGRPSSPQRGGNQSLLWQFSKNLKAKFGGRDEQQDG